MGRLRLPGARVGVIVLVLLAGLTLAAQAGAASTTVKCIKKIPFEGSTAHCETTFQESGDVEVDRFEGFVHALAGVVDGFTVTWTDSDGNVAYQLRCNRAVGASTPFLHAHFGLQFGDAGVSDTDTTCDKTTSDSYAGGTQTLSFDVRLAHRYSCVDRPTRNEPWTEFHCYFEAYMEYRNV